jgi:hypothetical protein
MRLSQPFTPARCPPEGAFREVLDGSGPPALSGRLLWRCRRHSGRMGRVGGHPRIEASDDPQPGRTGVDETLDATGTIPPRFHGEKGPGRLGQLAGLELGAAGEVCVLNGQAAEVRVSGRYGSFQRSFGG